MRLIDFNKIPFLDIPIAPVVKGESVHYEQGALKEWFDGTQDVEAVPLNRIKEAKEEVSKSCYKACITDDGVIRESKVLEILDKLITEVEE